MGDDVGYSVARALANFGEDGGMTGRGFQTAVSDLRKDAKGLIRKDSLRGYDAANSLRSVEEALLATAREQAPGRSEEHTSELQSLMRISYAVFCLKKKTIHSPNTKYTILNLYLQYQYTFTLN